MMQLLRKLPPVHELQKSDRFKQLVEKSEMDPSRITKQIQVELAIIREQLLRGINPIGEVNQHLNDIIWQRVDEKIMGMTEDHLTRVINGTGTVLHTNLGRARLSETVIRHVTHVAKNYSNLEYNIDEGKRGSRHSIIEELLTEVTGAEAAMVVNNNAAAVFLTLRALAKGKQVIVSRGQLVEIGGSFRISSIMEESGANLVEVGTTNKTHLYDYAQAIGEETAMLLKVHTSNFKTIGFTESVPTNALVDLKNKHEQVVLYEDLGSGSLYDFKGEGIGDEPVVRQVIDSGVDLVSFSGDKLLGGPQAGIIVGKRSLIRQLKQHQLARVLRVDKMTLAGLEKTLQMYLLDTEARNNIPTIRDITKSKEEILDLANLFVKQMNESKCNCHMDVVEDTSQIGGGTMPGVELPTYVVALVHPNYSAQLLSTKLRNSQPSVVTRMKDNRVLIDFRTIDQEEIPDLIRACQQLFNDRL